MSVSVRLHGVDLTVTRAWSRYPRVEADGRELPRDKRGKYQLRDSRGRLAPVEGGYDWLELRPRLRVGDETVLIGRRIPLALRVLLVVWVAVGAASAGALGAGLALASSLGVAALVRRPQRQTSDVVLAALLPVVAVAVYLGISLLVARWR